VDAVEDALRRHARTARGSRAFYYRLLEGREQFWPNPALVSMVRSLDRAEECQAVACEVAERFGFGIVVGWCRDLDGSAAWHCCNLSSSGELVDAGRDRHQPGFVGKVLSGREAMMLGRAAQQPSLSELGERGGSLLGALLG
jgi:hypothetical protein